MIMNIKILFGVQQTDCKGVRVDWEKKQKSYLGLEIKREKGYLYFVEKNKEGFLDILRVEMKEE